MPNSEFHDRSDLLRLEKLVMTNFRCFSECEVEFHPNLTVFLAKNGYGKTAVLDAIATILSRISHAATLDSKSSHKYIHGSDIRRAPQSNGEIDYCLPAVINADIKFAGHMLKFQKSRKAIDMRKRYDISRNLRNYITKITKENTVLPLIACYGINRMSSMRPDSYGFEEKEINSRLVPYNNCLDIRRVGENLTGWFETQFQASQLTQNSRERDRILKSTNSVKEVINDVLASTGWSNLDWSPKERLLTLEHEHDGRLPLIYSSDGIRKMVYLIADIAIRCAMLNPIEDFGPVKNTPGILLIDEICMHLHPSWQREILTCIRNAFPNIQLIVSTQSPVIVSTVDYSSIREFSFWDNGINVSTLDIQTQGVSVGYALATVMDVDPEPNLEINRDLDMYHSLIEDGKADSPKAKGLRKKLEDHFGSSHQLIAQCDQLIRFQKYKLRKRG